MHEMWQATQACHSQVAEPSRDGCGTKLLPGRKGQEVGQTGNDDQERQYLRWMDACRLYLHGP